MIKNDTDKILVSVIIKKGIGILEPKISDSNY